MREAIIDILVAKGVATKEEAAQAKALFELGGGDLISTLLEVGFPEAEVLGAASEVSRIPRAPDQLVAKVRRPPLAGLDLTAFRRLGAVPLVVHKGHLCVAFGNPEVALSADAKALPPHRPFLAPGGQIRAALDRMEGKRASAAPKSPDAADKTRISAGMPPAPGPIQMDAAELGLVEIAEPMPAAPAEDVEKKTQISAPFPVAPGPALVDDEAKTVAMPALGALAAVTAAPVTTASPADDEAKTVAMPALGALAAVTAAPVATASPVYDEARTVAEAAPLELLREAAGGPAEPSPEKDAWTEIFGAGPSADVDLTSAGAPPPAKPAPPAPAKGSLDHKRQSAISGIARYKTGRVLGRGGMATVYLADDTVTGQKVALKIMEPHLAEDPSFVERFRREMKTSASLDHDNVVRVLDCDEDDGNLYLAAEFVDAGTLKDLSVKMGRMPGALVAEVLYQSLLGLAHAHEKSLVHRDLKPANLMLTSSGLVKIGDFGIAKSQTDTTITQTGMLFGTPAYMSPEQAFGRDLDGRSDLFSMGTVSYELLTGKNPYHHEVVSTCLINISKASAPHIFQACPTVPPLLEEVITRIMRKDPNDRFAGAAEAAEALWPLVDEVRRRYGNVLARAIADPEGTARELFRDQGELEARRAFYCFEQGEQGLMQGAFWAFRATTLDPSNHLIASRLESVQEEHGFRFQLEPDEQLQELEAAIEKKPDSPALLHRGADICMGKKNLLGAAAWMKRYLLLQPSDKHVVQRLRLIVGDDALAPFREPGTGPVVASEAKGPQKVDPPTLETSSLPGLEGEGALAEVGAGLVERLREVTSEHRGQLLAAAAVIGVLVVLGGGLKILLGALGPARGSEATPVTGSGAVASPPHAAAKAVAPKPPPPAAASVGALSEKKEKKEESWLEERARRQRELFESGRQKLAAGDAEGAIADFNAALIVDAGSDRAIDILLARAKGELELGELGAAESDLSRVKKKASSSDPRAKEASALLQKVAVEKRKARRAGRKKRQTQDEPVIEVGTFEKALQEGADDAPLE